MYAYLIWLPQWSNARKSHKIEIVDFQLLELQKFVSAFLSKKSADPLKALPVVYYMGYEIRPFGTTQAF